MSRRLLYLLSVAVVAWAGMVVPLPLTAIEPGSAPSVPPLLVVDAETTPIDGDLRLLTVTVHQPSAFEAGLALFDDDVELNRLQTLIPAGFTRSEFFELERLEFQQSGVIATAVGLELAGHRVDVVTGAVVSAVLPGGPSDGVLRPADVIERIDGVEVATAEELAAIARRAEVGQALDLDVVRGDVALDVTVNAGQVRAMTRPGLGVLVETAITDLTLPFEIGLDPDIRIGGPSAGMMIALTVFDLISDQDLAAGRIIAGTGTVLADGGVGSIGGIAEKVRAAERAGADLLLVPAPQLDAARAAITTDLEVIGVATVRDAVVALGGQPA